MSDARTLERMGALDVAPGIAILDSSAHLADNVSTHGRLLFPAGGGTYPGSRRVGLR